MNLSTTPVERHRTHFYRDGTRETTDNDKTTVDQLRRGGAINRNDHGARTDSRASYSASPARRQQQPSTPTTANYYGNCRNCGGSHSSDRQMCRANNVSLSIYFYPTFYSTFYHSVHLVEKRFQQQWQKADDTADTRYSEAPRRMWEEHLLHKSKSSKTTQGKDAQRDSSTKQGMEP
jgi:hypothetical protein